MRAAGGAIIAFEMSVFVLLLVAACWGAPSGGTLRSAAGAVSPLQDELESRRSVRAAVERALPRLAVRTDAWITEHGCASCHQVPFALWGLNAARDAGFEVDARTPDWNRWSIDKAVSAKTSGDELWELLLAGSVRAAPDPAQASADLIALLLQARLEDGTWEAKGQLPDQRRPLAETHDTSSAWSRRALVASDAALEGATRVAASQSIEHLALRSLEPEGAAQRTELLGAQNADGGWPWLLGEPSDALGTGQALYALVEGGAPTGGDPEIGRAIARAAAYLVRTQDQHGGWSAPSTLEDKERAATAVSSDWGTAWAVIGLVRALGVEAGSPSY